MNTFKRYLPLGILLLMASALVGGVAELIQAGAGGLSFAASAVAMPIALGVSALFLRFLK